MRPKSDEYDADLYSLRGKIFRQIRQDIISGKYKSGDTLVETKLAEEFGVSRTPIREAIRQLERDGLVQYVPNKGAVVESITPQDVGDIYMVRRMIEGLSARWAAERISDEMLDDLKELVELMEFYTERGDVEQITKLDTMFHQKILEASNSRPLQRMLSTFIDYVQLARSESLRVPGRLQKTMQEHRRVYEAIAKRDPMEAEKALTDHICRAEKNLTDHMSKRK
ncbi:MAG TPA: GntR family transcriptional regulator [Firmicutes bacterium]|nr:GntR family transcriptional regulator [Bacillota bacterium]